MYQNNLKVATAEMLRFISPNGDIICSPKGHVHMLVIEEHNLSKKTGVEALMDVISKGYALVAQIKKEILITHCKNLTNLQQQAITELEKTFLNYTISLVQEEM